MCYLELISSYSRLPITCPALYMFSIENVNAICKMCLYISNTFTCIICYIFGAFMKYIFLKISNWVEVKLLNPTMYWWDICYMTSYPKIPVIPLLIGTNSLDIHLRDSHHLGIILDNSLLLQFLISLLSPRRLSC